MIMFTIKRVYYETFFIRLRQVIYFLSLSLFLFTPRSIIVI